MLMGPTVQIITGTDNLQLPLISLISFLDRPKIIHRNRPMHNICLKLLHGENTFDRLEVEPSYRLITGRLGMSYDNDINGSGVLS